MNPRSLPLGNLRRWGMALLGFALVLALGVPWPGLGAVLVLLAALGSLGALWLEVGHLHLDAPRLHRWAGRVHLAVTGALVGALGLLASAFLRSDLTLAYVWGHTHTALWWPYRLAGTWAGEAGTLLLWTTVMAASLHLLRARVEGDRRFRAAAHLALGGLVTLFTLLLLATRPFEATAPALLADPDLVRGAGLNELLQTPLMVIHPPVQFLAYGLVAVPGALALAHLATGDDAWLAPARRWTRRAWLAATAGLGLGALWAHYVLSFGGYWAWDPVEVANLLPWLALTALLHALRDRDQHGDQRLAAPLLAVAALALTHVATLATRSGLWVSVHAFTDPTRRFDPDAAARLLAIADVHLATAFFAGLAVALVALATALVLRRLHRDAHRTGWRRAAAAGAGAHLLLAALALAAPTFTLGLLLEAGHALVPGHAPAGLGLLAAATVGAPLAVPYLARAEGRPLRLRWDRFLGYSTAAAVLVLGVVLLLMLRSVNGTAATLYEARVPLAVAPLATLLVLMLAWHPLGRPRALLLTGASLLAGGLLAALRPGAWVLWGSAPLLVAGLLAGSLRVLHEGRSPRAPPAARRTGTALLLAGLLGLVVWSNPPSGLGPWSLHPAAGGLLWVGSIGLLLAGAARLQGLPLRPPTNTWRRLRPRLGRVGLHLVHVAVLVGLLGYAVTTHAVQEERFQEAPVGEAVDLGGLTLRLGEPRGEPHPGGWLAAVEVPVHLEGAPGSGGEAVLRFYWRGPPIEHYDPHLEVHRGLLGDLQLVPEVLHLADGETVEAHEDGVRLRSAHLPHVPQVTHVTFTARSIPGMTLVWGGLSLAIVGLGLLLAGAHRPRGSRERPEPLRGT